MTFGIAGVQMQVSAYADNVPQMASYMAHIRKRFPWVRMVLFSELSPLGPDKSKAEPMPGPLEQRLCELAEQHALWLIPGSMVERDGDRLYNATPIIDPTGRVIARYRKMFPFQPYEAGMASGTEFCVFDVPGAGRFGFSNCYDMWFPETTRTLAAMGAEVILHPTMTDTIDRDVELAIARASAVQNQVYFFDINGVGDGGVGRSIVCDPSGNIVHQSQVGPEIVPVAVDFEVVRREREQGLRSNLGQPLKSFRDRAVDFAVYRRDSGVAAYLDTLGPLKKPD